MLWMESGQSRKKRYTYTGKKRLANKNNETRVESSHYRKVHNNNNNNNAKVPSHDIGLTKLFYIWKRLLEEITIECRWNDDNLIVAVFFSFFVSISIENRGKKRQRKGEKDKK